MAESFVAHLSVDKSIVELLSKSTYQRNFSYALREMVSNAYDADATKVSIDIGTKAQSIIIQDNGSGMTREDFGYYLRIAGKQRGKLRTARFGRSRIGRFGVGFLSVFPFSKSIKVTTKIANSVEILSADVPAAKFFKQGDVADVESIPVNGVVYEDPGRVEDHFTIIELSGLSDLAKAAVAETEPDTERRRSSSILDWSPLDRLRWELQDELPLAFREASPYTGNLKYPESQTMQVFFDSQQLFRTDVSGDLLAHGTLEAGGIKCRYALCTPWKAIAPIEMRHVKIRLNNVGVGVRTDFDIARVRPYSHLSWITGELDVLEGLADTISVSRDTFIDSPQLADLRSKMAAIVRKNATSVENIESSRKTIARQVKHGKQAAVASTREVVEKNIQRLKDKGFRVETVAATRNTPDEPVTVDRSERVVRIVQDHPAFADSISIGGTDFKLIYEDSAAPGGEPCQLLGDGSIKVHTRFPLFRSRRYGEIFKTICVLSVVAKAKCSSPARMHKFFMTQLQELFKDY